MEPDAAAAEAPISRQELDAKHWATRVNIKTLADLLNEAVDQARAGRLNTTYKLRRRTQNLHGRIIYQITELATANKAKGR